MYSIVICAELTDEVVLCRPCLPKTRKIPSVRVMDSEGKCCEWQRAFPSFLHKQTVVQAAAIT